MPTVPTTTGTYLLRRSGLTRRSFPTRLYGPFAGSGRLGPHRQDPVSTSLAGSPRRLRGRPRRETGVHDVVSHDRRRGIARREESLGRKDSNLRMADPKSAALPLGYSPVATAIVASPHPLRGTFRRRSVHGEAARPWAPCVPAAPGALSGLGPVLGLPATRGSDLDVDPGDAQSHAAWPARRGTATTAAPADRGQPIQACQPARPGPAVGASLRGALIGHGWDHTVAAGSRPGPEATRSPSGHPVYSGADGRCTARG